MLKFFFMDRLSRETGDKKMDKKMMFTMEYLLAKAQSICQKYERKARNTVIFYLFHLSFRKDSENGGFK